MNEYILDKIIDELGVYFLNIPKEKIKQMKENKTLKNEFVEIGKVLAEYEHAESENLGLQLVAVFSADNMKCLFQQMREVTGYEWERVMKEQLFNLFQQYEMQESDAWFYIDNFMNMMKRVLYSLDARFYEEMQIGKILENTTQLIQLYGKNPTNILTDDIRKSSYESKKSQQDIIEMKYSRIEDKSVEKQKIHWELHQIEIHGVFGDTETRKSEIKKLTSMWKAERLAYPAWYIAPPEVRNELRWNTHDFGLIQYHNLVSPEEMLEYAYEFAWRHEIGFIPYFMADQKNLRKIWDAFYEKNSWIDGDKNEKWFDIGLWLLREYREDGAEEQWTTVLNRLSEYDRGEFSEEESEQFLWELKSEEIKRDFMQMKISEVREKISFLKIPEKLYHIRLQMYGIMAECGMEETAVKLLRKLGEDIGQELKKTDSDNLEKIKGEVYWKSILYCVLFTNIFYEQGISFSHKKIEDIENNDLNEQINEFEDYGDFQKEKDILYNELSRWYRKKMKEEVPFELNRETKTIIASSNDCPEAYGFCRVIELMSLPLYSNHVSLLDDNEEILLQYLSESFNHIWLFMMVRSARTNSVKACLTREKLAALDKELIDRIFSYTYHALDTNINIMRNYNSWNQSNIYTELATNGIIILERILVCSSESQQMESVVLLKKLIAEDAIKGYKVMDEFIHYVMNALSENVKCSMMNVLLECSARKTVQESQENAIDPFDVFTYKEVAIPQYRRCRIEKHQIEKLLCMGEKSEQERKTAVGRLGQLFDLGLLDTEQSREFGKLLWNYVDKNTGLPDLKYYYVYVYLKWPSPEEICVSGRIKSYLIQDAWRVNFCEETKLTSLTLGNIPYFHQIRLINEEYMHFWTVEEQEWICRLLLDFWISGREEMKCSAGKIYIVENEAVIRYRMVVRTAVSFGNHLQMLSNETKDNMKKIFEEMETYGIPSLEGIVLLAANEEKDRIKDEILDRLYDSDREIVTSAAIAAWEYLERAESWEKEEIICEFGKLVRARKQPGLNTFLTVLHNIFYKKEYEFPQYVMNILWKAIMELEKETRYGDNLSGERRVKECIEIRKACAGLAFEIYRYECRCNMNPHSQAVLYWRDICMGNGQDKEFTEVRNQWLDFLE